MKSRTEQIRISFEEGQDRLMKAAAVQTAVRTGFTFATIRSGRSSSASCPMLLNRFKLPTTLNSS
jgi:hypothetical protein